MKKYFIIHILFFFIFTVTSCTINKAINADNVNTNLLGILKNDTVNIVNLSNKKIKTFPDLSAYTITKLDLSNNYIEDFNEEFLPKGITDLDISKNKIKGVVKIKKSKNLSNVNMSYNEIEMFLTDLTIKKLNISNNKLKSIQMPWYTPKDISLDTLNISNNMTLSNVLGFIPEIYKVIYRDNISNKEQLKSALDRTIKD